MARFLLIIGSLVALTSAASADNQRRLLLKPSIKCLQMAALAFADQSEPASSIAKAAIRACDKQISTTVNKLWSAEQSKGTSMTKSDVDNSVRQALSDLVEPFVIEMRSNAKKSGDDKYYEKAAKRLSKY